MLKREGLAAATIEDVCLVDAMEEREGTPLFARAFSDALDTDASVVRLRDAMVLTLKSCGLLCRLRRRRSL